MALNIGNLALLRTAAELGLIDRDTSSALQAHYRELRRLQHEMRLNKIPARSEPGDLDITAVRDLWKTLFGQ